MLWRSQCDGAHSFRRAWPAVQRWHCYLSQRPRSHPRKRTIPLVGLLSPESQSSLSAKDFRAGLQDLGYIMGQNIESGFTRRLLQRADGLLQSGDGQITATPSPAKPWPKHVSKSIGHSRPDSNSLCGYLAASDLAFLAARVG